MQLSEIFSAHLYSITQHGKHCIFTFFFYLQSQWNNGLGFVHFRILLWDLMNFFGTEATTKFSEKIIAI